MNILWINPSFLDYRVPVYEELNNLVGGNLKVVFSCEEGRTPKRVVEKIFDSLGGNAIALANERTFMLGEEGNFANRFISIPWQPGLYDVVMNASVDVVIAEGYFQWSPLAYLRKMFKQTPIIISYERTSHTEREAGFVRTLYRKLASRIFIDAAIVNGSLTADYTHFLGVPRERIFTGCMAADSEFFRESAKQFNKRSARVKFAIPGDMLVFLYVGQIIDRKGIEHLVNAWDGYDCSACLVIAGDGERTDEIKKICRKKKFENIMIMGHVDYEELPGLYAASDIFVMPTLEDNWSLVVPEAMASGLPVACSIYNGCWPELIIDGSTGKVFDPLNEASIHQCLDFFIAHKTDLESMGRFAQAYEARYSPSAAASQIYAACRSVVAEHTESPPVL